VDELLVLEVQEVCADRFEEILVVRDNQEHLLPLLQVAAEAVMRGGRLLAPSYAAGASH
jgi:hypothetical protein